jgi:2-oxoglutarate ferredoxin oxidoreductase subunit alpha
MEKEALNIMIGGEAGQGLVTLGQLLGKIAVRSGYHLVVTQDYMSRVRGGHNTFALRISPDPIDAPQEAIDLLVALSRETPERHGKSMNSSGILVVDSGMNLSGNNCLQVPFKDLSEERYRNTVALALISKLIGLKPDRVREALKEAFGKHPEEWGENEKALEAGFQWGRENIQSKLSLPPVSGSSPRLMINGNEALALGALAGGLKFFAFYPMTPSTSIGQSLAGWAEKAGIAVEQGEDEIAVINMALGASFAGAPSMVATSGGGFALMAEGVSLAAMTETPVVVVVAQRPGPATGLPTRTEQADLEFVLHAGHGEFPRALFSPGTIAQCFALPQKALRMAEAVQGPVFLLTDQFLADSFQAVDPFSLDPFSPVQPWETGGKKIRKPYRRYAFTRNGISPRLLPGSSRHLVVADSDEHFEDGHITEDLSIRRRMVEKRIKKSKTILAETIPPSYEGDEKPDLLLVCWGSTYGPAREAVQEIRARGESAGLLHFSQVWPLAPKQFLDRLRKGKRVVAVEGNYFGQLARLIRRETGYRIKERISRYDGLPVTPEYVMKNL